MKYILYCHRPRTQILGPDSRSRELEINEYNKKKAKKALKEIKKTHKKMREQGYPWPGGVFGDFQCQPNDTFYLRLK